MTGIDWGVAQAAKAGQTHSGDHYLVDPFGRGVLIAAADGLGHGDDAHTASEAAIGVLRGQGHVPLPLLIQGCHESLKQTRGVALTLAVYHSEDRKLLWGGVGNVEAVLLRAQGGMDRLVLRPGVVGYQRLPTLYVAALRTQPGDVLVLATDGVRGAFRETIDLRQPPQALADALLRAHRVETDDALALVVRFA